MNHNFIFKILKYPNKKQFQENSLQFHFFIDTIARFLRPINNIPFEFILTVYLWVAYFTLIRRPFMKFGHIFLSV